MEQLVETISKEETPYKGYTYTPKFTELQQWFEEHGRAEMEAMLEDVKEGTAVLLKHTNSVFELWLESLPALWVDGYTCNLCTQYLDGVGSLLYVSMDEFVPKPFGLPAPNDSLPSAWNTIYRDFYQSVLELREGIHIPYSGQDRSNWFGQKSNYNADKGTFHHFFSPIPKDVLEPLLKEHLISPRGHGVGRAEIQAMSEWINIIRDTDFSALSKSDVKKDDKHILATFEVIQNDLKDKFKGLQSIYTRAWIAKSGLTVLYLKNTPVGEIVLNISKGVNVSDAIGKYRAMTDPRYYKRPVRLPSESEFNTSVQWLEEKGYAELLPMRLATADDVGPVEWTRPLTEAEIAEGEAGAKPSIFKNLAKKVIKDEIPTAKKPTNSTVENVSLNKLVKIILNKDNPVIGLSYLSTYAFIGSIAVPVNEEASKIYKEGKLPAYYVFQKALPFNSFSWNTAGINNFTTNRSADFISIVDGSYDDVKDVRLIYKNVSWLKSMNTPIFPNSLIDELIPHRRVIEHYGNSTPINVDEASGQVIQYDNTVMVIMLGLDQTVAVEYENVVKQYHISSLE